jgi:hypothetical protein
MYSYGQVESALARVHGISPSAIGAFRARIKHFQKIGIVTSSPGKGRRIDYSLHDVFLWGFGLELAEFGIDPLVIKRAIFSGGLEGLFSVFDQKIKGDIFFFFHPTILRGGFPAPVSVRSKYNPWGDFNWLWGIFAEKELSKLDKADALAGAFDARLGTINISRMRRNIETALAGVTRAHTANSSGHQNQ